MPIILDHATHTYMPGSPFQSVALSDVSFELRDGEFLGVIGHTGSGKSTFAQHLNGLLQPNSGAVLVNGVDISAKTPESRKARQSVGLVFQYPEYQLFEETVRKDIAFGRRIWALVKRRSKRAFLPLPKPWALRRKRWTAPPSNSPADRSAV